MTRIILFTLVLCACSTPDVEIKDLRSDQGQTTISDTVQNDTEQVATDSAIVEKTTRFTYQLIDGNHGWGYQIFEGSAMRINQTHIPAMPGINGFESSDKARITAEYIIQEMEKGTPLPVLSKNILDSLGVL